MSTFEHDHPRGQPRNAGQFRRRAATLPDENLPTAHRNRFEDLDDSIIERGERPLRPHLPLQAGDDDEFFDCPAGTRLIYIDEDGQHEYVKRWDESGFGVWADTTNPDGRERTAGEVWESLFESPQVAVGLEPGSMHDAVLHLPAGIQYSDRTHFIRDAS
ncbi:hypothetical protein [Microbacterium xylanilyticum]